MSTDPAPLIVSGSASDSSSTLDNDPHPRLVLVAILVVLAAILQVSVFPYLRLADGIPDVMAGLIVAVGLLRGQLVGAVAGCAGGFLIELTSPVDTLGAYALLYLVVGWFAGRYCERPESHGVFVPVLISAGAVGGVHLGYGVLQAMLGRRLPVSDFAEQVLVPTLTLSVLLFPLLLFVTRKVLGQPHDFQPQVNI